MKSPDIYIELTVRFSRWLGWTLRNVAGWVPHVPEPVSLSLFRWRSERRIQRLHGFTSHEHIDYSEGCMHTAVFNQVQPILGTRDVEKAVRFYVDGLGFTLAFGKPTNEGNYVGLRRNSVELHMQFQYEHEMQTTRLRIAVDDPDALYVEYKDKGVCNEVTEPGDMPWGTREFALYDLDRNALTFYREKPG